MQRRILQLLPDLGQQHLDLRLTPAQDAREQRGGIRIDGLELLRLLEAADLFHLGVFGPGADGFLPSQLAGALSLNQND